MSVQERPRRSALYLPGNNIRILEKGKQLPADVVILDLEDAVGAGDKDAARRRVIDAVVAGDYLPREVIVRINGIDTPWHDADLAAVATSGADGVLVPKVQSADSVRALDAAVTAAGAPASMSLWAMIETPRAFLHVEEIASAAARLAVLVIGTNDLISELRAADVPGRTAIAPMLALAVLGARAAGKTILDGVYNTIHDPDGFLGEARQGAAMGFDGKTVIHPSQIDPANTTFGPSERDVTHARRVLAEYDAASARGQSVIVLDGVMVEELHVRDARRVLDLAARIDDLAAAR
jgi:citrate lyase subunit beta/citryl-CoA lyase